MKKGFTLVELLVVIVIIGLLIAIAVPSGIAVSEKIKQKMLDTKIEMIEKSAIVWGQNNKSKITVGKNGCVIEQIINDETVSHCVSKKVSFLLNENALEEDKEKNGKKVLINPVTNTELNDCNVEIYIKNKRVYAKYDINGNSCGYEKVEDELEMPNGNPYLELIDNTVDGNKLILPDSMTILKEIHKNNTSTEEIQNGTYLQKNYVDPGYNLKDSEGSIIETTEDDFVINKEWTKCNNDCDEKVVGYYTYTYNIKEESLSRLNINSVEPVKRVVKLVDEDPPIWVDWEREYGGETMTVQADGDIYFSFYVFDNFDGEYTSFSVYDAYELYKKGQRIFSLNDSSNNQKSYIVDFSSSVKIIYKGFHWGENNPCYIGGKDNCLGKGFYSGVSDFSKIDLTESNAFYCYSFSDSLYSIINDSIECKSVVYCWMDLDLTLMGTYSWCNEAPEPYTECITRDFYKLTIEAQDVNGGYTLLNLPICKS